MEKFTNMEYYINSIRNEQDREIGASRRYGPFNSLEECVEGAENLHSRGYVYIEVMNDAGEIYCEYEN
jgi:hypothetical protein